MTEEGYRDGRVDLLRLLDAQRARLESRSPRSRREATWERALADVERAAGVRLDRRARPACAVTRWALLAALPARRGRRLPAAAAPRGGARRRPAGRCAARRSRAGEVDGRHRAARDGRAAARPRRAGRAAGRGAHRCRSLVREGDQVTAGQPVARIDDAAAGRPGAARPTPRWPRRAPSAGTRQATRARVERVFEHGIAARQEVDDATTRADTARAGGERGRGGRARARAGRSSAPRCAARSAASWSVLRRSGELVDGTPATPVVEVARPDPARAGRRRRRRPTWCASRKAAARRRRRSPRCPARALGGRGVGGRRRPSIAPTGLGTVRVALELGAGPRAADRRARHGARRASGRPRAAPVVPTRGAAQRRRAPRPRSSSAAPTASPTSRTVRRGGAGAADKVEARGGLRRGRRASRSIRCSASPTATRSRSRPMTVDWLSRARAALVWLAGASALAASGAGDRARGCRAASTPRSSSRASWWWRAAATRRPT